MDRYLIFLMRTFSSEEGRTNTNGCILSFKYYVNACQSVEMGNVECADSKSISSILNTFKVIKTNYNKSRAVAGKPREACKF